MKAVKSTSSMKSEGTNFTRLKCSKVEMLEALVVRGKEHGRGDIRKIGDALNRLAETAEGGLVLPFVDDVAQDLVPAHDLRPDFHQYSATISPK